MHSCTDMEIIIEASHYSKARKTNKERKKTYNKAKEKHTRTPNTTDDSKSNKHVIYEFTVSRNEMKLETFTIIMILFYFIGQNVPENIDNIYFVHTEH